MIEFEGRVWLVEHVGAWGDTHPFFADQVITLTLEEAVALGRHLLAVVSRTDPTRRALADAIQAHATTTEETE